MVSLPSVSRLPDTPDGGAVNDDRKTVAHVDITGRRARRLDPIAAARLRKVMIDQEADGNA